MSSPAASAPSRPASRRRVHYVDSSIQRPLLIAIVALELGLVAACSWLAHRRMIHVIEESMYRMNVAQIEPILTRLAQEGFAVLGSFALVNVIALMLAVGIWSYRQDLVMQDFTRLIGKTRALDFSSDAETQRQHEVLALAAVWRARERTRFAAIRDQVVRLEAAVSAKASTEDLRTSVQSLRKRMS